MESKTLFYKDIGDIRFIKNNHVKNLSIRLKPFEGIRVVVPRGCDLLTAQEFVARKIPWIKKNLTKVQEAENKYTIFDENTDYSTQSHQLKIISYSQNAFRVSLSHEWIKVFYPETLNVKDPRVQSAVRRGIAEALRIEAKTYIPGRVRLLAEKFGFHYNQVTIKNIKSRWGSCSGVNNLNFSLHLMRLPLPLVDFVILHELCHTVHHNHGPKFWSLLQEVSGNAKGYTSEMKKFRIEIY